MIPRILSNKLLEWAKQYPIVTLTGPRQSGKSTLCKALFSDKPYISLEDLSVRRQAIEDPHGFLSRFPHGAILDEIQRVPALCSYIQTIVDEKDESGMFILTGSAQFELMSNVSQSLAGRTAIGRLLPFSFGEIYNRSNAPSLDELLYTGFFPRVHDKHLNPTEALSFYVSTYLERDIRQFLQIKDLAKFEIFLKLLAGRSGQILNTNALAGETGLSSNTITAWITVLEQTCIVYRLKPFYSNWSKRLIKAPKIYILDTGLLCYLLNIIEPAQLTQHPLRGQVFESYIIAELLKYQYNKGLPDTLYYYRDQKGMEIDVVSISGNIVTLGEIKSSATYNADYLKPIEKIAPLFGDQVRKILFLGMREKSYIHKDVRIRGFCEPTLEG